MMRQGLTAQAAIIGFGRLCNMLAAAGTLMVLARLLPDRASYGAICQLLVIYMVLSQIFAVGLPQSNYYFLPRYAGAAKCGFLTQTILLLFLSGLLLGIGLYTGANLLGSVLKSPPLPPLLRVFAWYPILMLPTLAVEGTLLHAQRPLASVIFNALSRLGMFGSLVIPTVLGASLETAVLIWVGVALCACIAACWLMFATVWGSGFAWHLQMLRDERKFSLPLAFGTLIAISGIYVDRLVASSAFGAEQFGVYTNATVEIPTVTMVTNATAAVLLAEISRRLSEGTIGAVMPLWHRAMIKSGIVIFASFGFLVFWGHETMRLLFSDRFAESGLIFSIYVWSIPQMLIVGQALFIAAGATRSIVTLNLVGFVIETVCVLCAGYVWGLPGIALGAVLARYLATGYGMHVFVRHVTSIGWRAFLPWRMLGIGLAVALGAGAVSHLIWWLPLAHWPLPLVFALGLLGFGVCFLAGLHVTGLGRYTPFLRKYAPTTGELQEAAT